MNLESMSIGRFKVRQCVLSDQSMPDLSKYDLVLATISWESRCVFAMCSLTSLVETLHVFRFKTSDRESDQRKETFISKLTDVSKEIVEIQLGRSADYAPNVRLIEEFISNAVMKQKRPLRVLVDVTCFPKSYILFLLGMGFEKGYFAKLDCLYSEGNYASIEGSRTLHVSSDHGPISEGKWDSLSIPFFEAEIPIPKSRDVLVTVGGEVGLTVPFVEKYEPARLQIFGIQRSFGEQERLETILKEPNVSQLKFDVCDAVGVADSATQFCRTSREDTVTVLAVGSKPHALGLGIAGLTEKKIEIVCRVPKRYTMLDVPASGRVIFYEIDDRFEPHAYM